LRLSARWGLACAIGVASLAFLEAGARVLGLAGTQQGSAWYAGGNHPRFLFAPEGNAGYVLRPSFQGVEIPRSGEFRVPIAIDDQGLPVRPHPVGISNGVLAVGDSMTFGEGVDQTDSWTARLEQLTGTPVVNGGVPGYSSLQMAARADALFPIVQPRLVLLTFYARWDLWRCEDPLVYRDGFIVIGSFAPRLHLVNGNLYEELAHGPRLGPWSARALAASALLRSVLPRFTNRGINQRAEHHPSWSSYAPCLRAIEHAGEVAAEHGAAFRVVLIETSGGDAAPETLELERQLDRRRIAYVSLDTAFAGRNTLATRYPKDGHWNAAGHAAVAEVLAPVVTTILRDKRDGR
jgi:hypothetical protein